MSGKCPLSKFADDKKLGGMADTAEDWAARLSAERSQMRFNKSERRVLHLGRNNCMHRYRLRHVLLEKSSAEKDLGGPGG